MLSENVKKAWEFAKLKHENQQYGNHNYMYHIDRVLGLVIQMGLSEDYQIVACLHDVLEDTDTTIEEVYDNFGLEISNAVVAITKRKDESYEEYLENILDYNFIKQVKVCDVLSNLKESVKTNKHQLVKKYENALFFLCCKN